MTRILILGGTRDARLLAGMCVDAYGPEAEVITSLAGRTRSPKVIAGKLRVGGFGGAEGLVEYINNEDISVLVDATHPFAKVITKHAITAANETGVAHVMLDRPVWTLPVELAVTRVPSLEASVLALRELGAKRAFIATGVHGLQVFDRLDDTQFIIRQIEKHEGPPPFAGALIIVQKPPFFLKEERETLAAHNIDVMVTKESGGRATEAKLMAAAELGIHVIMVERPPLPPGEKISSPEEALAWIKSL